MGQCAVRTDVEPDMSYEFDLGKVNRSMFWAAQIQARIGQG